MKPEDKQLVIQDLCARLPYEPVIEYVVKGLTGNGHITCKLDVFHIDELLQDSDSLVEVKPYLRSMLSMTKEEEEEYSFLLNDGGWGVSESLMTDCIDWLNSHHFHALFH